ncbi:2-C-methyl-D-erythritol 4-phosphate cytidylyltransferase [Candidatus Epulonipiscium fishelsonii]|uniref:2-C-methyl-D-erythritol 4-phosphate cytidylyltransferase n=1 Tax=Candidatus Epulonipiscium fishelsonii TaxID=77094 RepID=A0ACC8XEV4_9FIRM|nr:2-C-methyl-D-erythritol 4-phosphate cytidylyltransferase [Epulopiscium sp. SCG-B05WGA-EpuloA1]ONI41759.1 2-C-methyl-D-erythritol 4-phosphate cytidylyltransferase [Epulopiscium sp. SCG-B11WGA-EpuloA1]
MISAIILAGGTGSRMNSDVKKQFIKLDGKEILAYTIEAFDEVEEINEIIIVSSNDDFEYLNNMVIRYGFKKLFKYVNSGNLRQDSVFNGLQQLNKNSEYVIIHDGARPFIGSDNIKKGIKKVKEVDACIFVTPTIDTIKSCDENGKVIKTLDRSTLFNVQTPQIFERELILKAHEEANKQEFIGTDDSVLVENLNHPVYTIINSPDNIKITTPKDLAIAEELLRQKNKKF